MARETALAHSLRTAELKTLLTQEHAYESGNLNLLWPALRLSQDSLRHLVFQLHQHTTGGGIPRPTGTEEMAAAAQLLSLCERYTRIEDGLTLCRLGLGEILEGPANTFRVKMLDVEAERRLASRFPGREAAKVFAMGRPPATGEDRKSVV